MNFFRSEELDDVPCRAVVGADVGVDVDVGVGVDVDVAFAGGGGVVVW